jgi:hypothetical protein
MKNVPGIKQRDYLILDDSPQKREEAFEEFTKIGFQSKKMAC